MAVTRLYDKQRWRRRSRQHLAEHVLCTECLKRGDVVIATDVHHVTPHKGNEYLFWFGELRGLCRRCHALADAGERGSRRRTIGTDGWPLDE